MGTSRLLSPPSTQPPKLEPPPTPFSPHRGTRTPVLLLTGAFIVIFSLSPFISFFLNIYIYILYIYMCLCVCVMYATLL